MEDTIKRVIICKARKIHHYKLGNRTDEKFLKRKEQIDKQYAEAKKNYLLTKDEKYKAEMKKIKVRYAYNVSRTEYELCLKDLEDLKEKYFRVEDDIFWGAIAEITGLK